MISLPKVWMRKLGTYNEGEFCLQCFQRLLGHKVGIEMVQFVSEFLMLLL